MDDDKTRHATNLRKVAIKAYIVSQVTGSSCTTFTDIDTIKDCHITLCDYRLTDGPTFNVYRPSVIHTSIPKDISRT